MKKTLLTFCLIFLCVLTNVNAQISFFVTSPSSVAGGYNFTYVDTSGGWGVIMNNVGVTDTLVVARDTSNADSLLCSSLMNSVNGKIAVVYRGVCGFADKAIKLQNAGAVGVIIINNSPGNPIPMGPGTFGPSITIPLIMISDVDGAVLRNAMKSNPVIAFIGNKAGAFNNDLALLDLGFGYYKTPKKQLQPILFGAKVLNAGSQTQTNVLLNIDVKYGLSNITSPAVGSIAPGTTDSLYTTTAVSLPDTGRYPIKYMVMQSETEQIFYDNVDSVIVYVTDSVYARHNNHYVGSGAWNGPGSPFEFGNLFNIYDNAKASSITITLANLTYSGQIVKTRLYEVSSTGVYTLVGESNPYTITAADINTTASTDNPVTVTLGFSSGPVSLQAGKNYLASVYYAGGGDVNIGISFPKQPHSYTYLNGVWTTHGYTTMVGLNVQEDSCAFPLVQNWTNQSSGFLSLASNVSNISACSPTTAWTSPSGTGTYFSKTSDGGASWQQGQIITGTAANSFTMPQIFGLNGNVAWALLNGSSPRVYKTINGGTTWTRQDTALYSGAGHFANVIHFFDANNGVTFGDPQSGSFAIYTTSNGGTSWTRVASTNIPAPTSGSEWGVTARYAAVGDTIWFPTSMGRIYRSTNKGLNWTVSSVSPGVAIYELAFKNSLEGITHATDWSVFKTSDGGLTWSTLSGVTGTVHNRWTTTKGTDPLYISYAPGYGTSFSADGLSWIDLDTVGHNEIGFFDKSTAWAFSPNTSSCNGMRKLDQNYFNNVLCSLSISKTDLACNNVCTGSAIATVTGALGNVTYQWSNSETTSAISNLCAGTYIVTATDMALCNVTDTINISEPNPLAVTIVSQTNATCTTCSDGSAIISVSGGTPGYFYSWSTGTTVQNPTNLPAGIHQLTVTDLNGCSETVSVTITASSCAITLGFSNVDATCYGVCNGASAVIPSGGTAPYTYSWSNGANASIASGLCAGNYTVTVTDALGCSKTSTTTIIQPAPFYLSVSTANTPCNLSNGSAFVSVTGGIAPYDYLWSSGDTTATSTNLSSGIYTITVTDNTGCIANATASISDLGAPTITVNSVTNLTCFGQSSGAIDISVSGGSAPYSYDWSNGSTQQDISGLVAGPYEITVAGSDGCTTISSINITQPDKIVIATSSVNADCNVANGSASGSVTGGTLPYTYSWSNSTSGSSINNVGVGSYSVTVTDLNGCSKTASVAITETGAAILTIDSIIDPTCGNSNGAIYVTTSGGSAPFNYTWSNSTASEDLINAPVGNYTLIATGSNGCSAVVNADIEIQLPLENPICLVTVDSSTNMNLVVWEKLQTSGIASYNIYKESSQAGVYYVIGNVPFNSMSVFSDTLSNPLVRAWRYKISAVDSCGNEGPLSSNHKTIHLLMNLGLNNFINLIWSHYEGFSYSTYDIHRYSDTQGWQLIQSVPASDNSFTDISAPTSNNLFYIVEASSPNGCFPTQRTAQAGYNSTRSNKPPSLIYVGVAEGSINNNLTIYPNPSKGTFQVSWMNNENQVADLKIYNMEGKLVYSEKVQSTAGTITRQIDLSNSPAGMYMFELISHNQVIHKKIILN